MLTSDYTILADATSTPITITLPTGPSPGEVHNIKKIDATINIVTVSGNGVLVEGAPTALIKRQNVSLEVQFDSTNWRAI
jgi:hypothetical protein